MRKKQMNCKKCQSSNFFKEPWTKIISPNVYELYDKITCRDCANFQRLFIVEIDKNTEATRKLLTGNYYVDRNGDVVPKKSEKKSLKEFTEEAQKEIDVEKMFS